MLSAQPNDFEYVTELSDFQLVSKIRRIEESPSAHRTAKVVAMVAANLSALRAEAARRGLTV